MSSSNNAADDKVAAAHKTLFDEGIKLRTQVNGAEYVEKSLKNGSEFARPMQELVTEACWGSVWARPGLEKKWRSLINVAMLVALNRSTELATHVKGALTNGATEVSNFQTYYHTSCFRPSPSCDLPRELVCINLKLYSVTGLCVPAHSPHRLATTSRTDSNCVSGRDQGSAATSCDLLWNASGTGGFQSRPEGYRGR